MSGHEGDGARETFTADELARRAGTLTTTVRMYQHRGLLAGPSSKRGRVALYTSDHLARLRLIADLQGRGHSLAGIKDLLDGWAEGEGLDDVLGLTSWASPRPVTLTLAELLERFGGQPVDQDDLQRAAHLGLLRIEGTDVFLPDARFLDVGAELVTLGVPVRVVLDEWIWLVKRSEVIATRFTELFERELWPQLSAAPPTTTSVAALRNTLERLGPLAAAVTGLALEQALLRAADRFLDRHGPAAPVDASATE